MAIVDGLTTLAAVKAEALISDTTQDTLLEALITSASAAIRAYLDREIKRTTHTGEAYAVNGHQYLYLREYPVQSVTSITAAGAALTVNVDYWLDIEPGRLYKPSGWTGSYYTRGTFPDVYAGAREILVTYVAGFYLPAEAGYVAGAAASLPAALQYAATRAVLTRFRAIQNQADGVKQYSEGGISTTWFGPDAVRAGGFDTVVTEMLAPYKRREVV